MTALNGSSPQLHSDGRHTILAVDDDAAVRGMLARLLRSRGYTVVQAADAAEALRMLARHRVDLVISDIVMPGESGIELRRSLLKTFPNLPVILISGYSADAPAEFAARAPHTEFMQKPFAADELLALVARILGIEPVIPDPPIRA